MVKQVLWALSTIWPGVVLATLVLVIIKLSQWRVRKFKIADWCEKLSQLPRTGDTDNLLRYNKIMEAVDEAGIAHKHLGYASPKYFQTLRSRCEEADKKETENWTASMHENKVTQVREDYVNLLLGPYHRDYMADQILSSMNVNNITVEEINSGLAEEYQLPVSGSGMERKLLELSQKSARKEVNNQLASLQTSFQELISRPDFDPRGHEAQRMRKQIFSSMAKIQSEILDPIKLNLECFRDLPAPGKFLLQVLRMDPAPSKTEEPEI